MATSRFFAVEKGETMSDLCSRNPEIPQLSDDIYFYQVVRREVVSEAKQFYVVKGSPSNLESLRIDEGENVDSIGKKNPKGRIITPKDIPEGKNVVVQTTSRNRKLTCEFVMVKSRGFAKDKRPRANEESSGRPTKKLKLEKNSDWLMQWNLFEEEDVEFSYLDQGPFVTIPETYCDESPPFEALRESYDLIQNEYSKINPSSFVLSRNENHTHKTRFSSSIVRNMLWEATNVDGTPCRLLLVQHPSEDTIIVAFEAKGRAASCAGNCGGHPYVFASNFSYVNSDGSTRTPVEVSDPSPLKVFAELIFQMLIHCSNQEH